MTDETCGHCTYWCGSGREEKPCGCPESQLYGLLRADNDDACQEFAERDEITITDDDGPKNGTPSLARAS